MGHIPFWLTASVDDALGGILAGALQGKFTVEFTISGKFLSIQHGTRLRFFSTVVDAEGYGGDHRLEGIAINTHHLECMGPRVKSPINS